jgi:hypothetical protein
MKEESELLSEMETKGEIRILGAMYDVATGQVSLLD